jgi:hypothetical protein
VPRTREDTYQPALETAIRALALLEPFEAAFRAGCDYDPATARISVPYFGRELQAGFPAGTVLAADGQAADTATRLLVLHYLIHADGSPPGDRWVAFRELPDARVYDPAFQKRSALRLLHRFGNDEPALVAASRLLQGEPIQFGDRAFLFRAFPRVRLAVIWHHGDEEFPPSLHVLFDAGAGNYLPTEDLAVLGGALAAKLIHVVQP